MCRSITRLAPCSSQNETTFDRKSGIFPKLRAGLAMPCSKPNHTRLKPRESCPPFLAVFIQSLLPFLFLDYARFGDPSKSVLFDFVSKEDVLFVSAYVLSYSLGLLIVTI
jgi:hypothetical protein